MVPGKNGPWKNGPRKNDPREKYLVTGYHLTHVKVNFSQGQFSCAYSAIPFERIFYFYRLIPLYTPRCLTLTPQFCVTEFSVCCRVLGFHRLITSQHSSHTSRCLTLTPRFFFRDLGLFASFGFVSNTPRTHHDAQRPPHDFLFPSFGFLLM